MNNNGREVSWIQWGMFKCCDKGTQIRCGYDGVWVENWSNLKENQTK